MGMLTSLLTSLQERRREMAILRAMGAQPKHIFILLISEAVVITSFGIIVGLMGLYLSLSILQPIIQQYYGIAIELTLPTLYELKLLGLVLCSGFVIGVIPAIQAYRHSLSDGMTIRL